MKEKIKKENLRKTRKQLETKLYKKNLIKKETLRGSKYCRSGWPQAMTKGKRKKSVSTKTLQKNWKTVENESDSDTNCDGLVPGLNDLEI